MWDTVFSNVHPNDAIKAANSVSKPKDISTGEVIVSSQVFEEVRRVCDFTIEPAAFRCATAALIFCIKLNLEAKALSSSKVLKCIDPVLTAIFVITIF